MNIKEAKDWTRWAREALEELNLNKAKKYLRYALEELTTEE